MPEKQIEHSSQNTQNAGFLIRLLAQLTDMFIGFLVFIAPGYLLLRQAVDLFMIDPLGPVLNLVTYVALAVLLGSILSAVYNVYFVSTFGGTIGKLAFGLKIVDKDSGELLDMKTTLYRLYPGYGFSSMLFGLGYFRIIKNEENLGWHDELFNTKVVKSGSWVPGVFVLLVVLGFIGFFGMQIVDVVQGLLQPIDVKY